MSELINDVFNSFYSKIRKEAALLHVQMLELHNVAEQQSTNCCASASECNMDALKELENRVMEIVKGLESRLENNFKKRFELIEKTIATLMESVSSDDEHAPIAPEPVAHVTVTPEPVTPITNTIKVVTPKQALPIPSKEVSPIPSPVQSDEEQGVMSEHSESPHEEAEENEEPVGVRDEKTGRIKFTVSV
jgi:hypothetical protein